VGTYAGASVVLAAPEPPQSVSAEMALLGALLLAVGEEAATGAFDVAADLVRPADFYRRANGLIFAAIGALRERRIGVDIVTVRDVLASRGWLDECGGAAYLMTLADYTPTLSNVADHARIVHDKAVRRRLMEAGSLIRSEACTSEEDVAEVAARAEETVFRASGRDGKGASRWRSLRDLNGPFWDSLESGPAGLSTGLAEVDRLHCGLHPGDLVILAGRPSMGKTAAALTMAVHIAKTGRRVGIFSMEMRAGQLMSRIISAEARVNGRMIHSANFAGDPGAWGRMEAAARTLYELPIEIDDTCGLTTTDMRARARRLRARLGGVDVLIVDYLQIASGGMDPRAQSNANEEVTAISQGLKRLAREMDVPVIALSQLSRQCERRVDKRPMLSDLRDSGSIEAEADVVVFLYRPSYYDPTREPVEVEEVEWIVAKNRNGPVGFVKVGFRMAYTQFVDLAGR
jgi:replicative DNA helicase